MSDLKSLFYPDVLRRFRQRFNEGEALASIMDQLKDELDYLKSVKVCLSLGTGYGEFDIKFIKKCLPNLKKLISVEKDPKCVEELKVNLQNAFGDELDVKIHEMTIEDFVNCYKDLQQFNNQQIDMVMAIHVLYFLSPDIRLKLYKLCFENLLTDEGMFLFVNATKEHTTYELHEFLKSHVKEFHYSEMMKSEIRSLNLSIMNFKPYECPFDLKYDKDLRAMYIFNHLMPVTEDMVKDALRAIAPNGKGRHTINNLPSIIIDYYLLPTFKFS